MSINIQRAFIIFIFLISAVSCQKGFLDTKPNISLSTVTTLEDCQLLLNNEDIFNRSSDPGLGQLSTDEFYITTDVWIAAPNLQERNAYIFAKSMYDVGADLRDWNIPYQQVYYANTVLDALAQMDKSELDRSTYDRIKGTALFYRSWAFYNLLQTFALPYDSISAQERLGIPLRLTSNPNVKSKRSTLQECYDQIISDVLTCQELLPSKADQITKPSSIAAIAFLARIHLTIGDFRNALKYASDVLDKKSQLVDLNSLDLSPTRQLTSPDSQYPIVEDIYHVTMNSYGINSYRKMIVDSSFYALYETNDLRKSAFYSDYQGYKRFKGSYEFRNSGLLFTGLATDEMYLIRAECNARIGIVNEAMNDLNSLLKKRFLVGTYIDRVANSADNALQQILVERKKELCFRGLRWVDLRRLNKEQKYATTITHIIDGVSYTLPPNDVRYAFPIPDKEIQISGIEQNQR